MRNRRYSKIISVRLTGLHRLMGAAFVVLVCAAPAWAGGLYIQEFATPSQATANAGAQAAGRSAATAFHNPASMTRLDDHAAVLGAGFLAVDARFDRSSTPPPTDIGGGDGGQQGSVAPVLSAHYVHRIHDREDSEWFDRFRFGFSLLSISGAVLDPDNDWAGRSQVQELSLFTLSFLPSVAMRVHETFSVGVGANLTYGRLDYKIQIPPADGNAQVRFDELDDFEAAPTVSFLWEPHEKTRIGALWTDKLTLDFDGDVKVRGGVGPGRSLNIKTRIPLVQAVRTSIVHHLTDTLEIGANFRWENWDEFSNQFVNVSGNTTKIPRRWDDTYGFSLGGRYRINESWALLSGMGYDTSPVKAKNRTADMPIDEQWRAAIGAQHFIGSNTIGASFSYANLGKGKIRSDTLRGSYDDNQLFSLTLYISFDKLPWSAEGS